MNKSNLMLVLAYIVIILSSMFVHEFVHILQGFFDNRVTGTKGIGFRYDGFSSGLFVEHYLTFTGVESFHADLWLLEMQAYAVQIIFTFLAFVFVTSHYKHMEIDKMRLIKATFLVWSIFMIITVLFIFPFYTFYKI